MKDKEYKVVFQLSSNDEQVCKSLLKQIGNVTKELPEIKMEIVTHGPGIELLLLNTRFINLLEELAIEELGLWYVEIRLLKRP